MIYSVKSDTSDKTIPKSRYDLPVPKVTQGVELTMLVLSRKLNEEIYIGDKVKITIVALDKGRVRLGISAPDDVPVHRKEVWETIKREREEKIAS